MTFIDVLVLLFVGTLVLEAASRVADYIYRRTYKHWR